MLLFALCCYSANIVGQLDALRVAEAEITDSGLATLVCSSQCHLRELCLEFCTNITDNGFGQLADSGQMPNLITLNINACIQLSDDTLCHIAKGFGRLVGRVGF